MVTGASLPVMPSGGSHRHAMRWRYRELRRESRALEEPWAHHDLAELEEEV
jgi:hypothetical protein